MVAYNSALTSDNLNSKLISRTTDEVASGKIDFLNGIKVGGLNIVKSSDYLDFNFTSAYKVPAGTTAQRPATPANSIFRYNSDTNLFEGYQAGSWVNFRTGTGLTSTTAYRSVTTTDSPTIADDILALSGASFTITLPTAVGNTGKEFTFLHEGTSLTQVYTFNTTSSQTIGGIASGVYKLYTNGEKLKIVSDGANWKITNHVAMTATVTTTLTITGTTSNPTKGTMTTDEIAWYRNGAFAFFHLKYIATTGGGAGSGNYLFLLPNSLTIDTTLTGADTGTSSLSNGLAVVNGTLFGQANTGSVSALYPQVHDSTHVKFGGLIGGALNYWGSGGVALSNSNVQMNGWFSVPISGWQP